MREDDSLDSTRRNVLKSTGALGVFAAATTPGVAGDDDHITDRTNSIDLTSIDESFTPSEWLTVGPFQFQRRDLNIDWLTPLDTAGARAVASGDVEPTGDEILPSGIAAAGNTQWRTVELGDGDTSVPLDFADVTDPSGEGDHLPLTGDGQTDNIQAWYGYGGVVFGRAYAYATFERAESGIAVLESDASSVWINGQRYQNAPVGVQLREGTNHVLVENTIVLGSGEANIEFRPPRAPVETTDVTRVPDLIEGDTIDLPAAVRVTNTTPERRDDATLEFGPAEGDLIESQSVDIEPALAPFETRIVNTQLTTTEPVDLSDDTIETAEPEDRTVPAAGLATTTEGATLADSDVTFDETLTLETSTQSVTTVEATVIAGNQTDAITEQLTVRGADENRIVTTYESEVDESVQLFGYRRPSNINESTGPYEVILNLHGASVDADSSAGSIVEREDAFVIAPETRGPVAYDHEDIGRLDDLEALDVAIDRFDIDDTEVYLTGHSMGGHGALHIGLLHSDRFAGVAPAHGWTEHESYIVTPFKRDRISTHPRRMAVRETSLHKNLATPFIENMADGNLPFFALHGGSDTSVPPVMLRHLLRAASERGLNVEAVADERYNGPGPADVDFALLEVPDADHLWDFDIGPGSDHFNHPDMFEFLRSTTYDPAPDRIEFYTANLGIEDSKYWIAITRQHVTNAPTRVSADASGAEVTIETKNVAELAVGTEQINGPTTLSIDGVQYDVSTADAGAVEALDGNGIVVDLESESLLNSPSTQVKNGQAYGPIRQIHYEPYRIVYGTHGTDEETAAALELANRRSHALADRARAPAPVIPDTAVTDEIQQSHNLVLIGTPSSNTVLDDMASQLPIEVNNTGVSLVGEQYSGDLAVQFIYPNPNAEDQLVQVSTGTSVTGLRLNRIHTWDATHTPTPDYMIFDDQFRYKSWNGCQAAGYFDAHWEISRANGFITSSGSSGLPTNLEKYIEDGSVTSDGLSEAFNDWQAGEISAEELNIIFQRWQQ